MLTSRERWFADVLLAGLETHVNVEPEILAFVTPAVLSKTMPREVLVRMFDSALTAGALSPEAIIQTVTPDLIAEFVDAELVWECLVAAAERSGIVKGTDDKNAREWLRRAVESGLRTKVLTPAHLVRHADAKILVHHLPDDLTAQLIESGLAAGKITPDLIIDILGVEPITTYAPTSVVWECLAEVGEGLVLKGDGKTPTASAPVTSAPAASAGTSSKAELRSIADALASVEPVDPTKTTAKRLVMDHMDDDMVSFQVSVDEHGHDAPPGSADSKRPSVAEKT